MCSHSSDITGYRVDFMSEMIVSDQWETPDDLYQELDNEYCFLIDACCTDDNRKAQLKLEDALKPWGPQVSKLVRSVAHSIQQDGHCINMQNAFRALGFGYKSVFMNPPYSKGMVGPMMLRAWEFSNIMKVVCLIPARSLSCKYLDILDVHNGEQYTRTWKEGVEVIHLSRRVKFTNPHRESSSPNFECCIVVLNRGNDEQ